MLQYNRNVVDSVVKLHNHIDVHQCLVVWLIYLDWQYFYEWNSWIIYFNDTPRCNITTTRLWQLYEVNTGMATSRRVASINRELTQYEVITNTKNVWWTVSINMELTPYHDYGNFMKKADHKLWGHTIRGYHGYDNYYNCQPICFVSPSICGFLLPVFYLQTFRFETNYNPATIFNYEYCFSHDDL